MNARVAVASTQSVRRAPARPASPRARMLVEAAPLAAPSAPPPASDPGNAAAARSRLDAFVAEASASVDRLRRHAESARVLAAEARARLDALDGADATLAATLARPRAALRVLARALNARTRDTLAALERAKAIVDAALVAHHRAETSSKTSDRKDDAQHAQHASAFAALLEEAEEDGLLAPLPRLPDAPAAEAVVVSDSDASASPRPSHHSSLAARLLRSSSSDAVGPPELAALELIAGGPDAFAADPMRAARLRRAVAALRAAERDVDARARLVAETRAISLSAAAENETKKYSYTEENFAYGSTPLASWLLVHVACPELLEATRALANDPQRNILASGRRRSSGDASSSENGFINPSPREGYAVWGSSSGWLVLYAALGLGVRAVGYELLECHVDTARRVARECLQTRDDEDRLSAAGEKTTETPSRAAAAARFERGDFLTLEGSVGPETRVVWLTSQCWDRGVLDGAARRLRLGLASGAIVVDYGDRLARGAEAEAFERVARVEAPVSWNANQTFHVFRKK